MRAQVERDLSTIEGMTALTNRATLGPLIFMNNGRGQFGLLLQRYRLAAGLSQDELAERAGVSRRGVADLERGARRSPHPATVRCLAEAMRLREPERVALLGASRASGIGIARRDRSTGRGARHTNLPAELSSFVGRERELGELSGLAASNRLLTLVGAGGIGKTRLALRVATDLVATYDAGVWFVRLDAVSVPDLVPAAAAAALEVREQDGRPLVDCLVDAVDTGNVLIVLDNCEHVALASAELAHALLERCARLHIIATSREALRVPGECTFPVPSMTLPALDCASAADEERSEAVRLFVQRAASARPGFALTNENASAVTQICRRLDGIPLAIELSAARVQTLSTGQLAKRLEENFNLLDGGSRTALPRHQTLSAMIDWSYDRISSVDQRFLTRLAVFSGTWSLETVEVVCSGNGIPAEDVLERVVALVDKSLVTVERYGEIAVYRLLEPIRRYALAHLVERGEADVYNRQLAAYMTDLMERAAPDLLRGRRRQFWLDHLEQEHDSLRTALAWAVRHDLTLALRLAFAAWDFWELRWHLREGRSWLERLVDQSSGYEHLANLRARAMCALAAMTRLQGDSELAATRLAEGLRICRDVGDRWGVALALNGLGLMAMESEDLLAAAPYFEECVTLWRSVGEKYEVAIALTNLALAAEFQGDLPRARGLLEESLRLRRDLGDNGALPTMVALARLAGRGHDRDHALALFHESLALARPLGQNRGTMLVLNGLASLALQDKHFAIAARLLGTAESLQKSSEFRAPRHDPSDRRRTAVAVRARMDVHEFAEAWEEGRALSPEKAVLDALTILDHPA
jgi:non-specific serine/threonine protein kinase